MEASSETLLSIFLFLVPHSESEAAKRGKYDIKQANNKVFSLINLSGTTPSAIILMECQDT